MNNLAKMSIDELEELLSRVTDSTSASPAEAVLQSKCIRFLSSEIAIFKEALSNNVSSLNGTIGITNKSIKELRDSIKDSTEKIINSNKESAKSQNINSTIMALLTLVLVIAGVSQVIIMNKQTEIMQWQLNNAILGSKTK
ncbi:MAG: hypothetical protein WCY09_01830 [Candidatus Omnitrophota bacterium]